MWLKLSPALKSTKLSHFRMDTISPHPKGFVLLWLTILRVAPLNHRPRILALPSDAATGCFNTMSRDSGMLLSLN